MPTSKHHHSPWSVFPTSRPDPDEHLLPGPNLERPLTTTALLRHLQDWHGVQDPGALTEGEARYDHLNAHAKEAARARTR